MEQKKIVLLAIGALTLIVFLGWWYKPQTSKTLLLPFTEEQKAIGDKQYPARTLPPEMPADLPFINTAQKVTLNYSVVKNLPGSKEQGAATIESVRQFEAAGNPQQNESVYKNYLNAHSYEVTSTSSPTRIALVGKKGTEGLTIVITVPKTGSATSTILITHMIIGLKK